MPITIEAIRAYIAERFKGKGIVIANDSPLRRLGHEGWRRLWVSEPKD